MSASLFSWLPCVCCGISEAITKTIASTSQIHILELLKANAGNSCFCTSIVSYQIAIRTNSLFHLMLNSVLCMRLNLCEKNSVSHKNELFVAVAVMYASECMCQKKNDEFCWVFCVSCRLSFLLSLHRVHFLSSFKQQSWFCMACWVRLDPSKDELEV